MIVIPAPWIEGRGHLPKGKVCLAVLYMVNLNKPTRELTLVILYFNVCLLILIELREAEVANELQGLGYCLLQIELLKQLMPENS